jgi:hypothetical protein
MLPLRNSSYRLPHHVEPYRRRRHPRDDFSPAA